MTTRMIAYTDPRDFIKRDIFGSKYRNAVHICATKSLTEAVRKSADKKQYKGPKNMVISAALLVSELLGYWTSTKQKLTQYARLTEVIREARDNTDEDEKQILRAFRLNQTDVLQTMRILSEVEESPSRLSQKVKEPEEICFVKIWGELEKRDESFSKIREKISKWQNDIARFRGDLYHSLSNLIGENQIKKWNKKILLHGFYFITPIQHRIFMLLKQAGFELIFMNLYDQRYPEIFKSVREFLSDRYGLVDHKDWIFDKGKYPSSTFGQVFASSFTDQGTAEQFREYRNNVKNTLKKVVYEDFYEFLDEYEKIENDHSQRGKKIIYLSPCEADLNNRLKEYYPENYQDKRHFLSYPFGQFLFHLHKMWDEQEEQLIIDDRALMECFGSGWLLDNETNENARDYMGILNDLLPFFQGCRTIDEWEETAQLLWEIRNNVVHLYEKYNNKGVASERFHRMLENPFVRFSYLNIPIEDVEQTIRFIKQLFSIARSLFTENGDRVSLHDHFKRIEEILGKGVRDSLEQEERILVDELHKKLVEGDQDHQFLVQDLADAISVYLGGRLSFEDDQQLDGEKVVISFQEIDGKVIEANIEKAVIHICGLDENSLPLSQSSLPWPLTKKTLESMKSNTSLYMVLLRENLKSEISRYLFYLFASFTDYGIVSWMRNWNGNDNMMESFYLTLLELPEEPYKYDPSIEKLALKKMISDGFEQSKEHFSHYPIEAMNELFFCRRRFFYSFLTKPYATYRKDFHLEFLFGTLIKVLAAMTNAPQEKIEEQVFALFPQWILLRKKILMEENYKAQYIETIRKTENSLYEGVSYPFVQRQFQFLLHPGTYRSEDSIREKWNLVFGTGKEVENEFWKSLSEEQQPMMTASPSKLCRFCPYIDECPDSYYPIDDDSREME